MFYMKHEQDKLFQTFVRTPPIVNLFYARIWIKNPIFAYGPWMTCGTMSHIACVIPQSKLVFFFIGASHVIWLCYVGRMKQ